MNAAALCFLQRRNTGRLNAPEELSPADLPPGARQQAAALLVHPELLARLWTGITAALSTDCRWIVRGTPVLVHPETGIIFGIAVGQFTYALRLPPAEREELEQTAASRAELWADNAGLAGEDRRRYLERHAGSVWRFPNGFVLDLAELGQEWAFGRFLPEEARWCRAAFDYAHCQEDAAATPPH